MNGPAMIVSVVIYTILIFWYLVAKKRGQLRRSGEYVAAEIGATEVTARKAELATHRLFNITEEMALAAGIPPPSVYLWPEPRIINAFAVGHTTADAALFVSQGAIDALSRDEMQALVGHRMSQVQRRHGAQFAPRELSVRVQVRAAGGQVVVIFPAGRRGHRVRQGRDRLARLQAVDRPCAVDHHVSAVPGARLLQAAISRERQRLADASAFQFTRNPDGLKGVMVKAMALGTASPSTPAILDDLAQSFFAGPVRRQLLDTHHRCKSASA